MPNVSSRKGSLAERTLRSQLIGYTRKERRKELHDAYRVKNKNYEEASRYDTEMLRLLDHIIHHMRQNNLDSENLIRLQGDYDRLLVRGVLVNDKSERLELGRSTIDRTRDALFDKFFDKHKIVNLIQDVFRKQEKKVFTMKRELEYLETYMHDQYDQNLQKMIAQLENRIHKIKARYETSITINERYQRILNKFEEEARFLPQRLEAMEDALWRNRAELKDMSVISHEAITDRDKSFTELRRTTKETGDSASRREKILAETNHRLTQQTLDFDRLKRKRAGTTEYHVPMLEADLVEDLEKTKMETLHYESLFETIKSGTLVPEIKDLIALLVTLDDILTEQKIRRAEMERKRDGLKLEKKTLQSTYKELKYTGAERRSKCKKLSEGLEVNIQQLQTKVGETRTSLEQNGNILIAASKGIKSMLAKLTGVDISEKAPETTESVCDRMMTCALKLKQLIEDVQKESSYAEFHDTLGCTLFQDKLEPALNLSIAQAKKRDSLSDFDFGGDTQALTRDDIKKRSRQMILANQKLPPSARKSAAAAIKPPFHHS